MSFSQRPPGLYHPGYVSARAAAATQAAGLLPTTYAGMDVSIRPEHRAALNETKSNTVGCVPNYRCREMEYIRFLKKNYPAYAAEVVIELTPEQRADKKKYGTATHGLRYEILNPEFMQIFMSAKKERPDKKHYGFGHIRKYSDAVLYCAKLAKKELPPGYYFQMQTYLDTLKKEKTKAKSAGKMEEHEADAIPYSLYGDICTWFIEDGNVDGWAFSTTQWNVMGRTVNVSPLGFHNMSRTEAADSVAFQYDKNKKDQTGENTSPKNCYANPFDAKTSLFLALGCMLCINDEKYNRQSDHIFTKNGKDASAGDTYCKALKKLINSNPEYKAAVLEFCREGHFHPHGTRKGSATHVTTATMEPAPIPSVLLRGEWSLGKVLELYWKWSKLGDYYLGRCLAGLDPDNEDEFGALPPHFTVGMENEYVKEAMTLCFGTILKKHSQHAVQGPLMLFLASMVHHSEFLFEYIAKNSSHPFQSIPILQRQSLLEELKKLVTLEPVGEVTTATGVPFRIKQMKKLKSWFVTLQGDIDKLLNMVEKLPEVIKNAIDEKCMESGQVTAPFVLNLLEEHSKEMSSAIRDAVREATQDLNLPRRSMADTLSRTAPVLGGMQMGLYRDYSGGNVVPSDFIFPSSTLRAAWTAWLIGFPNNRSIRRVVGGEDTISITPVRPLRHIVKDTQLPQHNRVRRTWADEWKPVLKVMNDGAKQSIGNTRVEDMNAAFVESTYNVARACLESKYPRLFEGNDSERNRSWKVATWSKKVREENRQRRRILGPHNNTHGTTAARSASTAATSAANWVNVTADPRFSITAVNNLAAAAADGTHEW